MPLAGVFVEPAGPREEAGDFQFGVAWALNTGAVGAPFGTDCKDDLSA